MPNITAPALTFPSRAFPAQQAGAPTGIVGELMLSQIVGKYGALAKSQKLFYTSAIITAPVIYSTAAQLGPMLWNRPGSGIDAHLLMLSIGSPTTAPVVAGSIGWASGPQTTAPTTATAITAVNCYAGGGPSNLGAVNSTATVIVLPVPTFEPLIGVNTGAVTVQGITTSLVDVSGAFVVGPGTVGYACASATLTTGVFTIGLLWAELPT